jgi:7-cyano-7-deazaguanine synthase
MVVDTSRSGQATAVLCSAGLDSAVLVAHAARSSLAVPVYVSVGLAWEAGERRMLRRLLAAPAFVGVAPLELLELDMRDLYAPTHWAVRGEPPAYDTPDEDVYLVGRNLVLLTKAGVLCGQRRIPRIAIGPLAGNPFPDATAEFFAAMGRALSLGLAHEIEVVAPFARMRKHEVIRLGAGLGVPFELTLSCMDPQADAHCGRCSKCRERRDAFAEAGLDDPARYVSMPPR